jgi:predicted RNase H-like nuclease (RuvC/YqgF family)
VIVRELPETLDTLWLRGLGKDKILSEAFTGIRSLPETKGERNDIVEVCIKHFKYLVEKSVTDLSEEEDNFMKTMQEIDTLYRAEMSRARQEARQEDRSDLILSQLNRRIGNLSIDLQSQVKALPLEMLGILGVDLLDFSGLEDLVRWLEAHGV